VGTSVIREQIIPVWTPGRRFFVYYLEDCNQEEKLFVDI
jgi:hypothetical protein